MKRIIIIVLGFTMFCGCKENKDQNTKSQIKQSTSSTDSVTRLPIKVFTIVHESTSVADQERFTELINSLDKTYIEDKVVQDEQRLDERLNIYKRKEFKKVLTRNFDNDNFTKALQTNVAFLKCQHETMPASLRVEEWIFKDESIAKSCVESLTTHKERTIYFKAISWILVQQKNKIYLIFALDYNVDDEPMQTVKQHLIDNMEEQGAYQVVEID